MARKAKSPEGWRKVSTGSFPANHDFKKKAILEGIIQEKRKIPQKRGKKTEEVFVLHIADHETGEITAVWESAALAAFMEEVKPGQYVKIESKGVTKLKGKKTLKQFDVFIRD